MSHPSSHNHKMSIMLLGTLAMLSLGYGHGPVKELETRTIRKASNVLISFSPKSFPTKLNRTKNWGTELLKIPKPKSRMSISIRIPVSVKVSVLSSRSSCSVPILSPNPNPNPSRQVQVFSTVSGPFLAFYSFNRHTLRKRDNGSNHAGQELSPHRSSYG